LLKAIVIGRKKVLEKYRKAKEVTQYEINALEQKFKLPDNVREWLKQQKLTDDEKMEFNLIESGAGSSAEATTDAGSGAGSGAGSDAEATTTYASANAGGRRRRKTSFRRRRMSRSSKSKSKSKSKKSRKSRKCVR